MKRLMVVVAALAAALLVQLTIVNGLPLPGGSVPDLVLLCVVAIGLLGGPEPGLIAGFCAGLALDLAPPSAALIGQYALVFCLVGYVSGRFSFTLRSSAVAALATAAGMAVLGEVLITGLVVVLGTPSVPLGTIARLLPAAALYDIVLSPVVMFAAVRIAVALGVSFNPLDDSPALEPGGSATPMGLAGLARLRQARHATASGAIGGGGWLTGDSAAAVPAVGTVGWLSGPATTRRARREQARLSAAVTGAERRKGAVWVGNRPHGLRPAGGAAAAAPSSSGLGRLRPESGVAGSATRQGLAGQAPSIRGSSVPKISFGSGGGAGQAAGWGADHGVPKIAFGTGSLPGSGRPRPAGRRAPKIAFRSGSDGRPAGREATHGHPGGTGPPKIAFGTGGLPGEGRATGRGVPRIRFGNGGLPGSSRARARRTPSIAFGSGLPKTPRRSPGRPALPRFAAGTARSASGPWLAGSRLRSAQFGGGAPTRGPRRRRPKAARWGRKRGYLRWLPFLRRTGGRSAVWRISRQIGGER